MKHDLKRNAPEFYDALASHYDVMTEFEKRFVREEPFFRLFVERNNIRTALDAGCGTGFHSLLLAQLNVSVTAVDISGEMLHRVQMHSKQMNLSVKRIRSRFEELQEHVRTKFDAVFCMGNSLVHLLTKKSLQRTLKNFYTLLNDHGLLFIQNVNYHRILARKERILNIKDTDGKTFVRFYDYNDKTIDFNILRIERSGQSIYHAIETVELMPWGEKDFRTTLLSAGFDNVKTYGSISLEPFHPAQSKDLVLIVRKNK